MTRLSCLWLLVLLVVAVVTAGSAQNPPLRGGQPLRPCYENCGGDTQPPVIELWSPGGQTSQQYPLIKVHFCDNISLNAASRYIKVNGQNQTSAFDYVSGSGSECDPITGVAASSNTTSVPLNLGNNTVEAHICDNAGNCATQTFTIIRTGPSAPTVALHNFNGDNQDRGLCLTIGAGQAAGLSCGDLFVTHSLPAYRTMGRDRSLTLVYNSATAAPRPVVAVWVTQPAGAQTPDNVTALLRVNGALKASATYSAIPTAQTQQLALAYDASGDATGLYPFTLEVRNVYGGVPYADSVSGTLVVVNRGGSEFGAGWWLAGLEQLVLGQSGNRILWLGGDGSAAVYSPVTTNVWARAAGGYRDTLVYSGGLYARTLRHGVQVVFDGLGRHIRTVNRAGHATQFTWDSLPGYPQYVRLLSVTVPPAGASGTTYQLAYEGAYQFIDWIQDPAGRRLDPYVSTYFYGTKYGITYIADPDGYSVNFGYDAVGRITSRRSRRNFTTTYAYANGLHVTRIARPLAPPDSARDSLQWWDERGLAIGSPGGTLTAVDTALVYTQVNGPRSDVADITRFWVDRWGAPTRAIGPVNDTTVVARDAITGLVTMVRNPVHDSVTMTWNGRGNLLSVTDQTNEGTGATVAVTTSYVYGDGNVPDSPTEVRTPVDTTRLHYRADLGVPDTATAQGGGKTAFAYYPSGAQGGLLQSVTSLDARVVDTLLWTVAAQTLVTSFGYDGLGNDTSQTNPSGTSRRYPRDSFTRVSTVYDEAGHRTDYTYDALNRMRSVTTAGLATWYHYSLNGAVDSIVDQRHVKRTWLYDAADRDTAMVDDAGSRERVFLNSAGLVDSLRSRRPGRVARYRYDEAGRLVASISPQASEIFQFGPSTTTIPYDSVARSYDLAGRLTFTSRSGSEITQQWNREGTLRSQRQLVRNAQGALVSDFTVGYVYDRGGRRTGMSTDVDTLAYTYGADGQLAAMAVRWGNGLGLDTLLFAWDALGRRDSIVYRRPNVIVRYGFDTDGSLRMVCSRHVGSSDPTDYLRQVLHYRSMTPEGMPLQIDRWRGAGGAADVTCASGYETVSPEFFGYDERHQMTRNGNTRYVYDGSGNRIEERDFNSNSLIKSLTYFAETNRLNQLLTPSGFPSRTYDQNEDGATHEDGPDSDHANGDWRWYFYNNLGEMVGIIQQSYGGYFNGSSSGCRYDALGRRVLPCDDNGGGWLGFDGANVIRERTTSLTRWRFVHGPGLDEPLVGMFQSSLGVFQRHYFIADGRGRLLAFTTETGLDRLGTSIYTRQGGNQAGAITNSNTFDANSRANSAQVPSLSFFRNRYYDQYSGRWSQEDPIGVAGGVNLYQFVGNNPAAYTDPFGLCPEWVDGIPCTDVIDSPMEPANSTEPSGVLGSEFGHTRSGGRKLHSGFDWRASAGKAVRAPANATVTAYASGTVPGQEDAGNFVVMDLGNGATVSVSHLEGFEGLEPGRSVRVSGGTVVGYVGRTGNASTSPRETHGHVVTRVSGQRCNPRAFFSSGGSMAACATEGVWP